MNSDPRQLLDRSPMSALQVVVIAVTIALNALDGFDVLAISFASPGIVAEWGIDRAALGFVLAAEFIGMGIGSLLLGGVADKFGRRPMMLGCLVLMSSGMFMVTTASSILQLAVWRVTTGVGIGGMLAATNAVAAEYSNLKRRHLCVSLMATGYPVGAVLGGIIAANLLKDHSWRSVFYFGSIATAAMIPTVWFLVPETIHWLTAKNPPNALTKINRTLARIGLDAVNALPITERTRKTSYGMLFAPSLIRTTLLVAAAYFFHVITFYFILKWVPQIVVDMGFAASAAAGVLVWANVGGATGGFVLGLLSQRFSLKSLTIGGMLMSSIMVIVFGYAPADLGYLAALCACVGFFTNGVMVGMYAVFAQTFPTALRASGTGFSIGLGRGGSMLSPILVGILFQADVELPAVALVVACGSLVAAIALSCLRIDSPAKE
jgi:benzoate transport